MRVLIVAAVLACAAAAPSGLLAAPYGSGLLGHGVGYAGAHGIGLGHGVGLGHGLAVGAVAPTISPGDIAGAAIDAHVDASDHTRAAVDAHRELHDQASEIQGQAINAAEDHSWQAVDAGLTATAQLDGAAAGVAPIVAKQLVGHGAGIAAPLAYGAGHGLVGAGLGYGAHGVVAPAIGYGAHGIAGSKTIATQSLSQTHPAPIVHAPVAYGHGPVAYGHGPVAYGHGPIAVGHGLHGNVW